jgi:hypothetical protein
MANMTDVEFIESITLADRALTMTEFRLYGETYKLAPLDEEELGIFKAQFITLLAAPGSSERKVMVDRVSTYILGIRAIKQALNSPKFRGLNPSDTELGFGLIRPQFTRANAAYRTTWSQALSTTWADWLFETAGNPFSVGKDFGLIITHLKSLTTPEPYMAEARFEVGRSVLIPVDTRNLRMADTENNVAVAAIPTVLALPKTSLYARARADATGTDEVPLGGLVVGLGRVLKEETPTWTA